MSEFDEVQIAPEAEPTLAVETETPAEAVEPEVVYVPEPEPAPVAPAPVVEEAKSKNEEPAAPALGRVVLMSSLKYQALSRRSLSVAYVQERLVDLGYGEAGSDKRGWFSVGTKSALESFAKSDVLEGNAVKDIDIIKSLFSGSDVQVLP